MFRAFLAIYVTALTAAGPWACCCTASRVAGALAADSTPPAGSQAGHRHGPADRHRERHARHAHGHSGHHHHAHGQHAPAHHGEPGGCCDGDHGSAPGEDGDCPCTDDGPTFVAIKETTTAVACGAFAARTSTDPSTAASAAVPAAVPAIRGAQIRNHASHFSSGQETLRALRAYLC